MKIKDLFEKWNLTGLKVKTAFLEADWAPQDPDRDAAWDLYVELLTRITTQALPDEAGDEETALDSVYSLFPSTREVLHRHGRRAEQFTRVAIVVLNQKVRPFTATWHKESLAGAFDEADGRLRFRTELRELQEELAKYTALLADIAGVEDLTLASFEL